MELGLSLAGGRSQGCSTYRRTKSTRRKKHKNRLYIRNIIRKYSKYPVCMSDINQMKYTKYSKNTAMK